MWYNMYMKDEQKAYILANYFHTPKHELAAVLGVTDQVIYKFFKKHKLKQSPLVKGRTSIRLTEDQWTALKAELATTPITEVINKYGVCRSSIDKHLKKHGLKLKDCAMKHNTSKSILPHAEYILQNCTSMTVRDMSAHLGIPRITIYYFLKRNGITPLRGNKYTRKITDRSISVIIELLKKGTTIHEIAKTYGVADITIRMALRRNGHKATDFFDFRRKCQSCNLHTSQLKALVQMYKKQGLLRREIVDKLVSIGLPRFALNWITILSST